MEPGRQFQQLDMFRTADQLKNGDITHGDGGSKRMWVDKLRRVEKNRPGWGHVPDANKGIREPVLIAHGNSQMLIDGHHRVAAAYDHSPRSLVPVEHEDWGQMQYDSRVREVRD